jgi:hypothetical protein
MRWFRRNQKKLLVFFGVLLMVSFLLGGILSNYSPSRGGRRESPANRELAHWKHGTLTEMDFARMRTGHIMTTRFLNVLMLQSQRERGNAFNPRAQGILEIPLGQNSRRDINRELLRRRLMIEYADAQGIVISDAAVLDYLRRRTDNELLTEAQLDQVALVISENQVDYRAIREQLKDELAVVYVSNIVGLGLPRVPNLAEAWSIYQGLNQRIEGETVAVTVDEMLPKVTGEPTKTELQSLFEAGRYELPSGIGNEPGFKVPARIAVGYLKANFGDFLERASAAITPEQIEAEYKRMVEEKHPLVMPASATPLSPPSPFLPPESTPDATDGALPPLPTESSPDGGGDPAPPPPGDSGDAASPPQDAPAGEGGDDDTEPSDDGKGGPPSLPLILSAVTTGPSVHLTTLLTANAALSVASTRQDPAQDSQDPPPAPPATEAPESQPPETAPGEEPVPPQGTDVPPRPRGVPDPGASAQPKPLAEVADVIRRQLALEPARQALADTIVQANSELLEYQVEYDSWQATLEAPEGEREPEPAPLDYEALANKYKLTFGQIPLSDILELSESEISNSMVTIQLQHPQFGPIPQRVPVVRILFEQFDRLNLYQTFSAADVALNEYILWPTELAPSEVRTFDQARPAVEAFWRAQRARELAAAEADRIADQVNASGQSLLELFPDRAVATGEFAFYDFDVAGVENPGEDFMSVAFGLEVGKAAAALNETQSAAYVVRVTRRDELDIAALQQSFFQELAAGQGAISRVAQIAGQRHFEVARDWFEQLERDYAVRWVD